MIGSVTEGIGRMVAKLESRYNPENDTPPGPAVTWADEELRYAVMRLANEVDSLRKRVEQLESGANE